MSIVSSSNMSRPRSGITKYAATPDSQDHSSPMEFQPVAIANSGVSTERLIWWTHLDSNQGPLACEASALTGLSYASTGASDYRAARAASQERGTSAILGVLER